MRNVGVCPTTDRSQPEREVGLAVYCQSEEIVYWLPAKICILH